MAKGRARGVVRLTNRFSGVGTHTFISLNFHDTQTERPMHFFVLNLRACPAPSIATHPVHREQCRRCRGCCHRRCLEDQHQRSESDPPSYVLCARSVECVLLPPPPPPSAAVESDGPMSAPTTGTRNCGCPSRGRCYPDEADAPLPTKCEQSCSFCTQAGYAHRSPRQKWSSTRFHKWAQQILMVGTSVPASGPDLLRNSGCSLL